MNHKWDLVIIVVIFVVAAMLSGCATGPGISACDGWHKLTLTKHDVSVISDKLATGVLEHNEFGRKIGCW